MVQLKGEDDIYREKLPNICDALKKSPKNCCTLTSARKRFPVINWLPKYKWKFLTQDFVAGLTVGLTAIPQAIVYGTVAGLSPQYGLYSAFMGCFVYIIFGTCKDITVGPTAIMSLMVQTHAAGRADYAILLCFLSGIVVLLMGILKLGALVQFISIPATTGFCTAASITIASGQINNLFGLTSSSNNFMESWVNFFTHLKNTRRNDAILGVTTLILLIIMRKLRDIPCTYKTITKYLSLSRNALAVIIGTTLCYTLSHNNWLAFRVSGEIVPGIPPFKLPPFHTQVNGTDVSFGGMIQELGVSLAVVPLILVLESIAVAKAFSMGKIVDASQEMIALGIANILSSFVSSMPITGSFTRTAINNASGVKTTLGGAFTGILILMTLAFLTETFYYIPKSTLAAIIIVAMIFMRWIWSPLQVTVVVCIFWTLEYGILCGIVVNMLFILYKSSRPKIVIKTEKLQKDIEVAVVDVQGNLTYSSAEYLKSKVVKYGTMHGENIKIVVIRGEEIYTIDTTVALNIIVLKKDLNTLGCELVCWNWQISSAGVVCRLNHDARSMFKFTKTLQEVMAKNMQESTMTMQTDCDSTTVPL